MKFWFHLHPSRLEAVSIMDNAREILKNAGQECVKDPNEADFAIAIGGDGTVIDASRMCRKPIIAVNAGTLGYLAKVEKENLEPSLLKIASGDYTLEERMTLSVSADGLTEQIALNDAAILTPGAGVIRFTVHVDGVQLMRYTADGMIAATPTGSTGYSLSCGGPIVDPGSQSIVLTPVAPHTLVNRAIILSPESHISIVTESRSILAVDGNGIEVEKGTNVQIKKAHETVKFVSLGRESFIERLRKKLS